MKMLCMPSGQPVQTPRYRGASEARGGESISHLLQTGSCGESKRCCPEPRHGTGKAMSLFAVFPEAGRCHGSSCLQTESTRSLTSSAGRGWSQLWQPGNIPPPRQPKQHHHPGGFWLCWVTHPCRVCRASALSTRGWDVQPTTHLCHRTCQPSQCDRCTAKAGGMSHGDTPAYAHTPRSTRPPSLDHTCRSNRRTGHGSVIKPKQVLWKSWLLAVQGSCRYSGTGKTSQNPP